MNSWQAFWFGFSCAAAIAAAWIVIFAPKPMTDEDIKRTIRETFND